MGYGVWAIAIGHCIGSVCWFNTSVPANFESTFSDQFTCEITGKLIDDIGTNRAVAPVRIEHYCFNWVEEQAKKKKK